MSLQSSLGRHYSMPHGEPFTSTFQWSGHATTVANAFRPLVLRMMQYVALGRCSKEGKLRPFVLYTLCERHRRNSGVRPGNLKVAFPILFSLKSSSLAG